MDRNDHPIPGTEGVVVRVHRPKGVDGDLPCIYWMHGGGLILGSFDGDDARFDGWCQRFGCVGVSVEYRLAPETPYPGPLEDCYAGLRWVHDNAASLGVDRARLGIGGASAGAGLAAGLALLARDRGEVPVAFQLLIDPLLDDRQITASAQWLDPIWPPAANTYGWTAYLGDRKGGKDVPIYAAAARAIDLAGLPPTLIAVGPSTASPTRTSTLRSSSATPGSPSSCTSTPERLTGSTASYLTSPSPSAPSATWMTGSVPNSAKAVPRRFPRRPHRRLRRRRRRDGR